jgi:hypothetical protein
MTSQSWIPVDWVKLKKVRNFDAPFPIAAQRATMRFLMGQEVGSGGADAKLYFRSPLLTRADY